MIDDIEDEWTHEAPFDYIHGRYLMASIMNWPKLMERTYRLRPPTVDLAPTGLTEPNSFTKPGGWAEFQDWEVDFHTDDDSLSRDSDLVRWMETVKEACLKVGRDPSPGPKLKQWMIGAGFKNVHEQVIKLPFGPWAKDKRQVRTQPNPLHLSPHNG